MYFTGCEYGAGAAKAAEPKRPQERTEASKTADFIKTPYLEKVALQYQRRSRQFKSGFVQETISSISDGSCQTSFLLEVRKDPFRRKPICWFFYQYTGFAHRGGLVELFDRDFFFSLGNFPSITAKLPML
jgi:hypothetical protein